MTEKTYAALEPGPVVLFCPDCRGRSSALSVSLCKSVFYGAFAWARRTLNRQKRRFPARAVTDKSSTPALLKALSSKFRDKLPVAEVRAGPGSPLPKRTDRVCSQSW